MYEQVKKKLVSLQLRGELDEDEYNYIIDCLTILRKSKIRQVKHKRKLEK